MTTLSRWEPLAKEVMRELALGDDPVRLEVLERALAGAYQVGDSEVRKVLMDLIDERDTELDMMTCRFPRGSAENIAWHAGVHAVWDRLRLAKDSALAELERIHKAQTALSDDEV